MSFRCRSALSALGWRGSGQAGNATGCRRLASQPCSDSAVCDPPQRRGLSDNVAGPLEPDRTRDHPERDWSDRGDEHRGPGPASASPVAMLPCPESTSFCAMQAEGVRGPGRRLMRASGPVEIGRSPLGWVSLIIPTNQVTSPTEPTLRDAQPGFRAFRLPRTAPVALIPAGCSSRWPLRALVQDPRVRHAPPSSARLPDRASVGADLGRRGPATTPPEPDASALPEQQLTRQPATRACSAVRALDPRESRAAPTPW